MSTRLLLLVLVPVAVVCLLAGSLVVEHRSAARSAREVERGVGRLAALVTLRDALQVQLTATSFTVRAEELGTTTEVVSTYFGFDVTGPTVAARRRASLSIAELGDAAPTTGPILAYLYQQLDRGEPVADRIVEQLSAHLDRTERAIVAELDRLSGVILAAEVDERALVASLSSLRVATRLTRVAARQGFELSVVWFPMNATPGALTPLAALAQDTAAFEDDLRALRSTAHPAVKTGIEAITGSEQVRVFTAAVHETLAGVPYVQTGAEVDDSVIQIFAGYLERGDLLTSLVTVTLDDVRSEAAELADREVAALVRWIGAFTAISVATLAMGWVTARSISRPLRDLARYAQEVNRGELDTEPTSGRRGPREARVAHGLFHDLVLSLRLLDAKAIALARCELDDPVLGVPFPGRLGQSFESSVAVLAGSIVERDALQSDLAYQSTHDALTGLRNRGAAMADLRMAMHRADRQASPLAVLFLDLNEFKSVNDRFGHAVGDAVLCEIAHRIQGCLRTVDFVARLGGDEFVIVAERIGDLDGAITLAERVVHAVDHVIVAGPHRVHVGVAVGISVRSLDTTDPLVLLSQADEAMYRAKRHERSGIEIFDETLRQEAAERIATERALTAALRDADGGGLCLRYQPVLTTNGGRLVGVEALVRWDRDGNGLVPPDSFIPVAESTDLIIDVDCWVLEQAAAQLTAWSKSPELAGLSIAVNVSGRHLLSGHLPGHLERVISHHGIDASLLSIEITETVLLTDLVAAGEQLDAVHALGVSVAIDDFGTGYTSPAHLQFLPMDTIKIDRSFVSRMQDGRGSSLVRMIIELAHAIDVHIVAEGVETEAELRALDVLGADFVQGFLLSEPLEAGDVAAFATARRFASTVVVAPPAMATSA